MNFINVTRCICSRVFSDTPVITYAETSQEIRRAVIREADVVLATLNTCGADVYSACMENFVPAKKYQPRKDAEDDFFSAVVIDEAGQVVSCSLSRLGTVEYILF